MGEFWCEYQHAGTDDTNIICTAHMHEGRAFNCPYKNNEDMIQHHYQCEDYKPMKSSNVITPEEIAEYRKWKQYQAEGRLIINPFPRGDCQCTASYNETVITGLSNNCEPYIKAGPIVNNND